eukprot:3151056-Alexandrium_andersonii.AAC.1
MQVFRIQHTCGASGQCGASGFSTQCLRIQRALALESAHNAEPRTRTPGLECKTSGPSAEASGFGTHAVPPESAHSTSDVSAQCPRNQPT